MLFHSLRVRLLATLILVAMVAVGTVALFTSRTTAAEFHQYVTARALRERQIIGTVLTYYRAHEDGAGLQRLVEKTALASGERIIVADAAGVALADSANELNGRAVMPALPEAYPALAAAPVPFETRTPLSDPAILVRAVPEEEIVRVFPAKGISGATPGALAAPVTGGKLTVSAGLGPAAYLKPLPPDTFIAGPPEQGFLGTLNRSLVLAVLAAAAVVLLLTLALSRRILGPVEALTRASRRMERGDLSQRVAVTSKDEIGELARAFNAMADSRARLEALRRNMVTDIAHELRTPMTNLRGYLEALRDGVAAPTPETIDSLYEESLPSAG
jgi:methyl-accepting chemotaxis protein